MTEAGGERATQRAHLLEIDLQAKNWYPPNRFRDQTLMIKLTHITVTGPDTMKVTFSDGSEGQWSAAELIDRASVLTAPLADPAYFSRAFIDAGALAWPNGLALSPRSLQRELR